VVFLLVLTAINDMAQAWWGRELGRRRLAPGLSPGKTWLGFLGGALVTVILAVLLAPLLTPLAVAPARLPRSIAGIEYLFPFLAGLLIALTGLAGDLTFSGFKRAAGVKDGSTLLPGMGGAIDRVDSGPHRPGVLLLRRPHSWPLSRTVQ